MAAQLPGCEICATDEAHDGAKGRRHRWPDEVKSADGGLERSPDVRRTADRPYLGTEGRVEERYAADVRAVSRRGDDMLGMKLHRVGAADLR